MPGESICESTPSLKCNGPDSEAWYASMFLPLLARYDYADVAIALAALRLPYLLARLVFDFAVADADALRDRIAIAVLRQASKLACG